MYDRLGVNSYEWLHNYSTDTRRGIYINNSFVMFSHGGSVIPNFFANYRFEVGKFFIYCHVAYQIGGKYGKLFEYG